MKNLYFLSALLFFSLTSVAQMVVTPASGCAGTTFNITISGLPQGVSSSCGAGITGGVKSGNAVVVAFSGGAYATSTSNTASLTIPANFAPGTYSFSVTRPTDAGCTFTTTTCSECFTVLAKPQITNVTGATTVCNGDTLTYSATASGTADAYTWEFPSGWNTSVTGSQSSTSVIAGATSGKIYVTPVSAFCGIGGKDSSLNVTSGDVPAQPVISAVGTNLTSSSNLATQQWYRDANLIAGAIGPSYTATQSGSYTVVASNDCGNSAASTPSVVTISGINSVAFAGLKIYPNPVQNNLVIENNNGTELQVSLYGLDGSLIKTTAVRERAAFDMTALAAGIYTLKVSNGTDTRIEKITKQ